MTQGTRYGRREGRRIALAQRIRELERDIATPIKDLIEEAERAVLAEAQPGTRSFTDREQGTWDGLVAELDRLDTRIGALIKLDAGESATIRTLRDRRYAVWQEAKALLERCQPSDWMRMESIR